MAEVKKKSTSTKQSSDTKTTKKVSEKKSSGASVKKVSAKKAIFKIFLLFSQKKKHMLAAVAPLCPELNSENTFKVVKLSVKWNLYHSLFIPLRQLV